ncbi:MAG: hypothetical protein IJ898_07490 [Prevotella sp.]|nr:hypothetical protein [Prevotella sp.]
MKKSTISIIMFLLSVWAQNASAQLADGFYHIKNVATGRYLSINDINPDNYKVSSGDVNMGGIRTYLSYDTVAVSPSCVIFVKRLGNGKYDFCGQGSSLYTMSSDRFGVDIIPYGGAYKISGTAKGITKRLSDGSPSNKDSWLMNRLDETQTWVFLPIDTSKEYVGIRPDVRTADGTYYGTIYAGFNFRMVSEGMAAFYVSNAEGTGFTMKQIEGDVVPAGTPVIIRCNSAKPEENKIEPVIGGNAFANANWLSGVYCSLSVAGHRNTTLFDFVTMRILGLNDKGELAFIANPSVDRMYKELFLMANKAYLRVNPSDAEVLTIDGYTSDAINKVEAEAKESTSIYTLTGNRVPNGAVLRPGVYIQNGKKRLIK